MRKRTSKKAGQKKTKVPSGLSATRKIDDADDVFDEDGAFLGDGESHPKSGELDAGGLDLTAMAAYAHEHAETKPKTAKLFENGRLSTEREVKSAMREMAALHLFSDLLWRIQECIDAQREADDPFATLYIVNADNDNW